ncbi:Glutathione S-transferase 3 like protein [Verticillium longisporum]|nr:Glutathione S-transferase 3 like protein [Verticillium longisporum]
MTLIVHHLHVSMSERIPWLCEELGVPYELKGYDRDRLMAPAEFKALHPAGTAPVIQDGDLTLAESGACVEYISHKHAQGKLFVPPSRPEYATFLFWWHWSNATLQSALGGALGAYAGGLRKGDPGGAFAFGRSRKALSSMNDRLGRSKWLAGENFTVADLMCVFQVSTFRYFYPIDLGEYEHIVGFLKRVGEREAYQRAMAKSDPGMELVLGSSPPSQPLM